MTDSDEAAPTVEEGLSELRRSLAGPVLGPTDTGTTLRVAASTPWSTAGRR